jgi:hypothetical protein
MQYSIGFDLRACVRLQCYAQSPAEKGFCADGVFIPPSSYSSLTDTGSQTPRYSVLKNMPASHLKAFLTETRDGNPLVSSVKIRDLTIQNGLKETNLPKALTNLVNNMPANMYVNNDVSAWLTTSGNKRLHSCSMV